MKLSALLVGALSMALTTLCYGFSALGQANVLILPAIGLHEQSDISFGSISQNDGICDLVDDGSLVGIGADCEGAGQLGLVVITGDIGQSISIAVDQGEGVSGVDFEPALQSEEMPVLVGGKTIVKVGGRLITQNAQAGDHQLTYYLTVNYN